MTMAMPFIGRFFFDVAQGGISGTFARKRCLADVSAVVKGSINSLSIRACASICLPYLVVGLNWMTSPIFHAVPLPLAAEPAIEIPTTTAEILIMGTVYCNRAMEATSVRKKASLSRSSFSRM
ncbi:hypothetical protein JTP94_20495 [Rhizobium lusitanum]|nr:hypothetical protein [Rhizobium lusitanum]